MRMFVQLDVPTGNVVATLESLLPPGDDPLVIPDAHLEVTGVDQPADWFVLRWTGAAFEARADLG